jgi:hypothetical protein
MNDLVYSAFFDELEKTSEKLEGPAFWQAARDLPVVVGAAGVGFALGKEVARLAPGLRDRRTATGAAVALGAGIAAAYAHRKVRARLKERREAAQAKQAGVAPAPQSRSIPRRKPSDPWQYDPRPASWI